MENAKYAGDFKTYLDRLHTGERDAAAWEGTLGVAGEQALEADYKASLTPDEVTTLRTKYTPPVSAPTGVRPMDDAEVHVLWARLRNWKTPEGRQAAGEDLNEATRTGDTPELAILRALFQATGGDRRMAKSTLDNALKAHSDDARLWNALGWLTLEEMSPTTTAAEARTKLAPIAEKLVPTATTSAQLDFLAHASLIDGNLDAALAYEKRAVAVDPNCVDCLAQAATAMLRKGLAKEALEVATLAQGLLPEGARPAGLEALVAEAKAKSAAAKASVPTSEGR